MREPMLFVHVLAGFSALVFGPLAVLLRARPTWRWYLARGYPVSVTVVGATALGLVALRPQMWWLAPVAVAAAAAAWAGVPAGGGRPRSVARSPGRRLRCTGGSYIALVTAAAAVNIGSLAAWVLPTVIGTVLIELVTRHPGFRAVPGSGRIGPDAGDHPDSGRLR